MPVIHVCLDSLQGGLSCTAGLCEGLYSVSRCSGLVFWLPPVAAKKSFYSGQGGSVKLVSDIEIQVGGVPRRRRVYCLEKDPSQLFLRVRELIKVAPVAGPEPEPWIMTHVGPQTRAVTHAVHQFYSRQVSSVPRSLFGATFLSFSLPALLRQPAGSKGGMLAQQPPVCYCRFTFLPSS